MITTCFADHRHVEDTRLFKSLIRSTSKNFDSLTKLSLARGGLLSVPFLAKLSNFRASSKILPLSQRMQQEDQGLVLTSAEFIHEVCLSLIRTTPQTLLT